VTYPSRRSERTVRTGFTLVEALVAMGIIAVLLALLLPALGLIRTHAQQLRSLSNLRQIGQSTSMYTDSYGSYYYGTGGWIRRPPDPSPFAIGFSVWQLDHNWPALIHDIAPWTDHYLVWVSPRTDPQPWTELIRGPRGTNRLPVSYQYSHSFVADPAVWSGRTNPIDESSIGPIRPSGVRYPSSKVLMFDADRSYLREPQTFEDPRPLLFADGSARAADEHEATTPVQNRLLPEQQPLLYHDTPEGVHGRDY